MNDSNTAVKTYKDLLKEKQKEFEKKGMEDAIRNAAELLGAALGERAFSADFEKRLENTVDLKLKEKYFDLCKKRLDGEPLQYLIGEWEFYGIELKVGKGVLIPRQDTEIVAETAIKLAKTKCKSPITFADLCSGSGCIALALEKNLKSEEIFCVEKSHEAIDYLRENLKINKSKGKIVAADVLEKVPEEIPPLDMIVCNPPYLTNEDMKNLQKEVSYEPVSALFGGDDGMDFYRGIVRLWTDSLKEGGIIVFEVGAGGEDEVMKILIQAGYENVRCKKDLCGINRCVFGIKPVQTKEFAIKVDYSAAN